MPVVETRRIAAALLMFAAGSATSACLGGGGEGSGGARDAGDIADAGSTDGDTQPEPGVGPLAFWQPSAFAIGESGGQVWIDNVGAADLVLSDFRGDFDDSYTLYWSPGADPGQPRVGIQRGQNQMPAQLVVAPGASLMLLVLGGGPDAGRVVVASNDPDNPTIELPIVRQTVPVVAEPNPLRFGRVDPGRAATRRLTLTNTTDDVVDFSDIRIEGADEFDARLVGGATLDDPDADGAPGLPPGAACTLEITYATETFSADEALLVVTFDLGLPLEVPLRANGPAPCMRVAEGLNFFPPDVGLRRETVRIESCGAVDLVVSAIAFDDDSSSAFRVIVDDLPRTLAARAFDRPDDGFDFQVEFDPPDEEIHAGTLWIESDADASPRRLHVFGQVRPE